MLMNNTDTVFPRIIARGDFLFFSHQKWAIINSREASLESPGNCSGPKCGSYKANQSILFW